MGQHVSLEITSTGGRKVALITIEKLFYGVSEHVRLKGIRPRKGESTLCATERFFPCMCSLVFHESTSLCARVFAYSSIERFFFWMGLKVSLEIRSSFARAVALFANEKFIASTLGLNNITWCVDCLHFCDRPSTKVEGQLMAKVVRIFGEGQWKVKVIELSDSDVRFLPFWY